MRDAFGGAFMIRLFVVFIFIYMFFTAIALNYAKAFKVKNRVIDYLEDNEIVDVKHMFAAESARMSDYFEKEILGSLNYRVSTESMNCSHSDNEVWCENGIRITQYTPTQESDDAKKNGTNKLGTYYRVDTYFTWELGFLKILLRLNSNAPNGETSRGMWQISGETRTIVKQ